MTKQTEDRFTELCKKYEFVPEEVINNYLEWEDEDVPQEWILEMMNDEFESKHWAVFEYLGEDFNRVEEIAGLKFASGTGAQYDYIEIGGEELRVMDDWEADNAQEDCLTDLVEQEFPKWLLPYIDYDQLMKDSDRGQDLSGYDGCEHECSKYTSETIYIYRNN